LKPLGHPPSNGQKYFATATLEDLRRDLKWLARASDLIVEYWRIKNRGKYQNAEDEETSRPQRRTTAAVASLR
jgi:hypothetical protein